LGFTDVVGKLHSNYYYNSILINYCLLLLPNTLSPVYVQHKRGKHKKCLHKDIKTGSPFSPQIVAKTSNANNVTLYKLI